MTNPKLEAQRWLNHPKVSVALKDSIRNLTDAEIEQLFSLKKPVFGTAGVRDIIAPGYHGMNVFSYAYLTQGYVKYIATLNPDKKQLRFLVARDTRKNGDLFSQVVCDVITAMGHVVYMFDNNEPASTPLVSYVIRQYHFDGGVNITASHNPKIYNGFKIYNENGAQLLESETNAILELLDPVIVMLDLEFKANNELLHFLDNEAVYQQYFFDLKATLINHDKLAKNLPIVYTGLHGTSVKLLPRFLDFLGYTNCISVKEQNKFDEEFSTTTSLNPETESAWELALQYAYKNNAKLMIALDPDADRFAIAEWNNTLNDWHFFSGNETGSIVAYYKLLHKKFTKKPYIVSTYVSTYLVDKIAQRFNALVHRTNVGFKFIGQAVDRLSQNHELVVGFEEAVGMLASDQLNREKDGFQATAIMLEIVHYCYSRNISLYDFYYKEIFSEFGDYFNWSKSHEIKGLDWKEKTIVMLDKLTNCPLTHIGKRKILKVKKYVDLHLLEWDLGNDNWIRFRISGTEPKLKFYFNLTHGKWAELEQEAQAMHQTLVSLLHLNEAENI